MKLFRHDLSQLVQQLPTWQMTLGSTVLLVVIWVIDYLIQVDLGLSIFYVLPIAAIAWYVAPSAGYFASLGGAVLWFIAESARTPPASSMLFLIWNTAVRLAFWLLVVKLLAELKFSYQQAQKLASIDFLTGLLNRRAFMEVLEQEVGRASRYGLPFTLAYLDVDNFKQVNDRWGHAKGDWVLQAIAEVLRQDLRESDSSSRLGGDEFAMLMPQTDQPQAKSTLLRLFQELTQLSQTELPIGFSIGAVTFLTVPQSADQALAIADKLMYTVKAQGKNQVIQTVYQQPSGS